MSYGFEKAAEYRRADMLRDAERARLVRIAVGERRRFSVRRPVGSFLVRLGSRLGSAPQREGRLAGSAGNVA